MKNILTIVLVFCVLAIYAKTTRIDPINGDPPKISINANKNQVDKPYVIKEVKSTKKVNTVWDDIQAGIANCFGVAPSEVCCLTGSNTFSIPLISFVGPIDFYDCGFGCTRCCVYPPPNYVSCCFIIDYDYP